MPTAYAARAAFSTQTEPQPSFPRHAPRPLAALPYLILQRVSSPSGSSVALPGTRSQHRQLGVVLAHAPHFLSAHPHDAMDGADTVGRHQNPRALRSSTKFLLP